MSKHGERHLVRGILAGVAGGLAASWVMNEFMAGPGQKLQQAVESDGEREQRQAEEKRQEESGPPEDATMKVADAVVKAATGGRHLSLEGKQKGGPVVHYSFGALIGALYGALSEYSSAPKAGFGSAFGSALFAVADLIAVPALNLAPPATEQPPSALATPFAAHLVYGVTTELVRRTARAIL